MSLQNQLLDRFLASSNWAEARDLVARQPALLAPEIDAAFAERLSRLEPGLEFQDVIDHQQLLGLCRIVGVDTAFQDLLEPIDSSGLVAILSRLPMQGTSAARRILFSRRVLSVLPRDMMPPMWAMAVDDQAKNLMSTPLGNAAANREQAIYWLNEALRIRTREAMPAEWAETTSNLGTAYVERVRGDRATNMERAIELFKQALASPAHRTTPGPWVVTQACLALAYQRRIRGDKAENLERSIKAAEASLTVATRETMPIERANVLSDLALIYIERIAGDREENLQRAIECCEATLQVRTREDMPHEWAETMGHMGSVYLLQARGDRKENIEQARRAHEQALEVTSREHRPKVWAGLKHGLGVVYLERLEGDAGENVEQAIRNFAEALTIRTRENMQLLWAWTTSNFGAAHLRRRRGVREQNVERAWQLLDEAFAVLADSEGSREWAFAANNLANACLERSRGDRSENLERGIELYEMASGHLGPRESIWATRNLARAFFYRVRGARSENLDRARHLYEGLLPKIDGQPEELANTYDGVAMIYRDQSMPGDRTENVERALAFSRKALEVLPTDAHLHYTLGNTLLFRPRGHRQDNLRQAAEQFEAARMTPGISDRTWALASQQLAMTYVKWEDPDRDQRLEQAIELLNKVIEELGDALTPLERAQAWHLLGDAYNWRIDGDRAQNLEKAIEAYETALRERTPNTDLVNWTASVNALAGAYRDRRLGDRVVNLRKAAALYHDAIALCPIHLMPFAHRELQGNLGRLQFYLENWEKAILALAAARRAGELLYEQSSTTESRQAELRQSVEYPSRAAYSLARLGRFDEAVEVLEAGRTRFLAEALGRGEVSLEGLPAEDRERFVAARDRVNELEAQARAPSRDDDHDAYKRRSEELGVARTQLTEVIDALRHKTPAFLEKAMDFPAIVAQAQQARRPLCYLVATPHGSLALIVRPDGEEISDAGSSAVAVWQNDFSFFDLRSLLRGEGAETGYLDALSTSPVNGEPLTKIWPRLEEILATLVDRLGQMGYAEAVLIPCGPLGMLPLHALHLEQLLLTVTPSARALRTSLSRARSRAHLPSTLFAVGNPSGDLSFAELEVAEIVNSFSREDSQILIADQATREAVLGATPAKYLHCACHGKYDLRQPLDSCLVLAGDERVCLRDLLDGVLDLSRSRLAILSACKTAVFDTDNVPDEMIGLPAGMLLAGVPGVVGTLWPVNDLSTAFLMIRFLEHILERDRQPPEALRQAQLWLRQATTGDLLEFVRGRVSQNLSTPMLLDQAEMRCLLEGKDDRPFEAPYYWAGFLYVGA